MTTSKAFALGHLLEVCYNPGCILTLLHPMHSAPPRAEHGRASNTALSTGELHKIASCIGPAWLEAA